MNLFSTNVPALLLPIIIEETGFHLSLSSMDGFIVCLAIFGVLVSCGIRCFKILLSESKKDKEIKK